VEKTVPEIVKEFRTSKKLTLRALEHKIAQAVGWPLISAQAISYWEQGRNAPKLGHLVSMGLGNDVEIRDLAKQLLRCILHIDNSSQD
jgi:transcriptional regulator with XRE-family HTH domain